MAGEEGLAIPLIDLPAIFFQEESALGFRVQVLVHKPLDFGGQSILAVHSMDLTTKRQRRNGYWV
jgi:hypothetical protein